MVLAGLLALIALQFALAFTSAPRIVLPGLALCMIVLVALSFMRLRASGTLASVFALVGVFWVCVMIGLGSMDPATRTVIPVSRTDVRPANGGR